MVDTINNDELLKKALGTEFAVNPAAQAVSLKPPTSVAAPVDFSAAKQNQALPVGEDYMKAVTPDLEKLQAAEEEKLKFQAEKDIDTTRREAEKQRALGESAAQQRREILDDPSRAEYKKALEDKAKPFIPHQENAQDLIALFGLLNVVGFAIGSGGKEYSQAAMSAMNGMLEGHRQGRDDLYKREKNIFETNQKQLDSRIKQLLAFMQDNELLTNMDKTARDQAIQAKFLEDGATFLLDYYKKNGYGKTVETLKEAVKASGKAAEMTQKENQRAADQAFQLRFEEQKATESRQRELDKKIAQFDLESQRLTAKAQQAEQDKDFRLKEELLRRAFEVELAKARFEHTENQNEINRKHSADIELARIERDKIRDKDTAEYREADLKLKQKEQERKVEADKATERYRKKTLEIKERQENNKTGAGGVKVTQQTMMAQRAVNSLGGVASAVESIRELPVGTTTGILPNLQTKDGLLNYVRNNIGRAVSPAEAEIMNTLFTGIGRNLASIEASGAATGLSELSKQMQSGTYINAGVDDPFKVAIKLADIRRIAVENIRPAIESGLMPEGQAKVAQKLVERIEKAIPFTTIEVVKAFNAGKQTIGQQAEKAITKPQAYDPEKEARYQKWLKEHPQ